MFLLKWPNDIYIGKKKICGILVQNQIMGSDYEAVYCGIGININQTDFSFAPNPTSLKIELNINFDIEILLQEVLDCIRLRYETLKYNKLPDYKKEYLDRLLFYNTWENYIFNDYETIEAKIIDVDNFGRLILEKRSGMTVISDLKQLKFLF